MNYLIEHFNETLCSVCSHNYVCPHCSGRLGALSGFRDGRFYMKFGCADCLLQAVSLHHTKNVEQFEYCMYQQRLASELWLDFQKFLHQKDPHPTYLPYSARIQASIGGVVRNFLPAPVLKLIKGGEVVEEKSKKGKSRKGDVSESEGDEDPEAS